MYHSIEFMVPSLLWAKNYEMFFQLDETMLQHLQMDPLLAFMGLEATLPTFEIFLKLPTQVETMYYRQGILEDFIQCPDLIKAFEHTKKRSDYLSSLVKFAYEREATIYNLLKRVEEAESVTAIVEYLYGALENSDITSKGLLALREVLNDIILDPVYERFKQDMRQIKKMDGQVRSIKIGMNFDENLKPIEAIVLNLGTEPVKYTRWAKKTGRVLNESFTLLSQLPRRLFAPETLIPKDELNTLEKLLEPALKQLIQFCDTFNQSLLDVVVKILADMSFYRTMIVFSSRMQQSGYSCHKPSFSDHVAVKGFANISLLCQMIEKNEAKDMIFNPLTIGPKERLFVLTGANRGGKTTITAGIGQMVILAQHGFQIPLSQVCLKPFRSLFTLFSSAEQDLIEAGRLGSECATFSEYFTQLDTHALILMNEAFSGTSHLESLVIAKESMKALAYTGACVIFNTHLHELYDHLIEEDHEHDYMSWVTGSVDTQDSFVLYRKPPLGKSYALSIAKKYGVSYEQLIGEKS